MKVRTEQHRPTARLPYTVPGSDETLVHEINLFSGEEHVQYSGDIGRTSTFKQKGRKGGELVTRNDKVAKAKKKWWMRLIKHVEGYEYEQGEGDNKVAVNVMDQDNWRELVYNTTPALCEAIIDRIDQPFEEDEAAEKDDDDVTAPFPSDSSEAASDAE